MRGVSKTNTLYKFIKPGIWNLYIEPQRHLLYLNISCHCHMLLQRLSLAQQPPEKGVTAKRPNNAFPHKKFNVEPNGFVRPPPKKQVHNG